MLRNIIRQIAKVKNDNWEDGEHAILSFILLQLKKDHTKNFNYCGLASSLRLLLSSWYDWLYSPSNSITCHKDLNFNHYLIDVIIHDDNDS